MLKITIIGLGLVGGSLAAAFKQKGPTIHITAIDTLETIQKAKMIDIGYTPEQLSQGVEQADIIFLATPINTIISLLPKVGKLAKPHALITDVGSTKEKIITIAKDLPKNIYFIGGHPMTGSEKSGIDNIDASLFANATYVLTKHQDIPIEVEKKLVNLLESIEAKVIWVPALLHDEITAAISHLPRIIGVALMNYVLKLNQDNPKYLQMSAGGFRDMTRVAASSFDIWGDICQSNAKNIKKSIEEFICELQQMKEQLESEELKMTFAKAAKGRNAHF